MESEEILNLLCFHDKDSHFKDFRILKQMYTPRGLLGKKINVLIFLFLCFHANDATIYRAASNTLAQLMPLPRTKDYSDEVFDWETK